MVGAQETLPAEFEKPVTGSVAFTPFADRDVYANEVGFSNGFAVARDSRDKKMWLLHCYGAVGAGRDAAADSGGGKELYAVIGHAPRHLDRNVTLVGRVVGGMEFLSALPRGQGPLGFYEKPDEQIPIRSIRVATDFKAKARTEFEVLRTDTGLFTQLIESRRNRREDWFKFQANHIDICNVPIPIREKKRSRPKAVDK